MGEAVETQGQPTQAQLTEHIIRLAVVALVRQRDKTAGRSPLLAAREVKLDLVLDNQAAIMNALAMVLDAVLQSAGLPPAIVVKPTSDGRA